MSPASTPSLFGFEPEPEPARRAPPRKTAAAGASAAPTAAVVPAVASAAATRPHVAPPAAAPEGAVAPAATAGAAPAGAAGAAPAVAAPAAPGAPGGAATAGAALAAAPVGASGTTPMMQQYLRAKAEAGDALLFFRMGDFYELFHEDALVASRVLGITLTARSKGEGAIPMAGVPVKAYEGYLHTLIRAGHRVAICDQMEDPALARGLVERKVTRIVTAGTLYEDDLLERGSSNYLLALAPAGEQVGLAWLDVSTGAFQAALVPAQRVADEVSRLDPAELLLPESLLHPGAPAPPGGLVAEVARVTGAPRVSCPEWTFEAGNAASLLKQVLRVGTLEGFGLTEGHPCVSAAGAALAYVRHAQRGEAPPVSGLQLVDTGARAGLDRATRGCLELLATQREGRREGSLLATLDATGSAMGARLLREWIVAPLVDPVAIRWRQSAVAELLERRALCEELRVALERMPDLERIASRLLAGRGSPRDLAGLRSALQLVPRLAERLRACASAPLASAAATLVPLPELLTALEQGLAEHPAPTLSEGGLIAPGYDAELDRLRDLRQNGTAAVAAFQAAEAARLGIPALKVGFNKVFGYYVEITHAQAAHAAIPEHYVRKQTLSTAERYITPELKELETSILTAEEKSRRLESELFLQLRARAAAEGEALRRLAAAVAQLDVLAGFARRASERAWVRPVVDDGPLIDIRDGRHPVLDALLPAGVLVPNDVLLDQQAGRLLLITGPNMAGKSTYIRQVALLVLLAQIGSYVPATSAHIGVVDRIFTRVGAADDLSSGASTFMVEMTETAAILNGASARSLVILDEVGRGTSTWDGLSLAWAISEHLYRRIGARTLFATHYHELVDLADEFDGVRNLNVAVREHGDEIVFQHKIVAGGTDRSYGLHVARLAGVPVAVIERARQVLHDLERSAPDLRPGGVRAATQASSAASRTPPGDTASATPAEASDGSTGASADPSDGSPPDVAGGRGEPEPGRQRQLFGRPVATVVDEILSLDLDQVTPLDALLLLKRYSELLEGGAPPAGGTSTSSTLR